MNIVSALPLLIGGETYRVTSPFGWRTDPVTGEGNGQHKGIDLVLWKGYGVSCPVGAAWDGTVVSVRDGVAGFDKVRSAGNRVTIDHGDGLVTKYFHLKNGSIPVQVGDHVYAGQEIGYMGSTGYSTGAHLHFQLEYNGEPIDPLPFILGDGEEEEADQSVDATEMDNTPAAWAEDAVNWAIANGIIHGDENGNLHLHEPMTCERFLVLLYRALGGMS